MSKKKDKRKHKSTTSRWAKVRKSKTHGRGMFATRKIPAEMTVIEYVGKRIKKDASNEKGNRHYEKALKTGGGAVYIFVINDDYDMDGSYKWNTARLINHSCDPNCEAQIDEEERIWVVTTKKIAKGEELTFNYGFDLEDYECHPCCCGSNNCVGFIAAEEYWDEMKERETAKATKAAAAEEETAPVAVKKKSASKKKSAAKKKSPAAKKKSSAKKAATKKKSAAKKKGAA